MIEKRNKDIKNMSFPKSVIGNLNLKKADEPPESCGPQLRGWLFCNNDVALKGLCSGPHPFTNNEVLSNNTSGRHGTGWQRAFTLIELLVVVLIIGILSAIALPQYQKTILKTRFSTIKSLTEDLRQAAQVYYLANGVYPSQSDMDSLDIQRPESSHCTITAVYAICYILDEAYKLQYQIPHDLQNRRRQCVAFSTANLPNEVCRNETGESRDIEKDFAEKGYVSYNYSN